MSKKKQFFLAATSFQFQIPFSADIQFLTCISVDLIEYEVWWLKKLCAWRYVGWHEFLWKTDPEKWGSATKGL